MGRTKKDLQKELDKITDTVDINFTNQMLELGGIENFNITKKTLDNISKWALDGKSQFEIRQNLELSDKEWKYLIKVCPAIVLVMQRSTAYAEIVLAGTIYQTAIGGHTIKKKIPIKVKEYNSYGKVKSEHVEVVEYDEVQPPNPYLLKFLAEHKLSEQFSGVKTDNSDEHRKVVDAMSEEELKTLEKLAEDIDD